MTARRTPSPPILRPFADSLLQLCRLAAACGGGILLALAVMSTLSIIGRAIGAAPIAGDFELVEVGGAIAVFLFLPYCQLTRGNVIVDFFTSHTSARLNHYLDAAGSLLFATIAALLTWRLALGGLDMYRYEEQTMILGMARWWGFIPIVFASALLTLVCLYTTLTSLLAARR